MGSILCHCLKNVQNSDLLKQNLSMAKGKQKPIPKGYVLIEILKKQQGDGNNCYGFKINQTILVSVGIGSYCFNGLFSIA